eukprot:m.376819 g.376819  ORF g.376819 m.376819 type:complete len:254 (+) comp56190_c0_seq42:342-1103(+)
MRSTTRVSSTFLFQIDRSCVFGSHILSAFLIHCVWLFPVWFDAVGDITHLLHEHWGEMFLMGGLAGIPFCGKTGFTAFSHHVPNNGNIFILFAPHVGITRVGERCGLIGRHGHEHLSPACGAAIGAYQFGKDHVPSDTFDPSDYQMDFIKQQVFRHRARIDAAEEPMVELAVVMFDIVREALGKILNLLWAETYTSGGQMLLLGGVQINMDDEHGDYFVPLSFESHALAADRQQPPVITDLFADLLHDINLKL